MAELFTSSDEGFTVTAPIERRAERRGPKKMFGPAVRIVFVFTLAGGFFSGCAQIKEAGRTIGHTTRDVTKEIGHGARDVTRQIGHGTRDVVREIGGGAGDGSKAGDEEEKKAVKSAPAQSEY